MRAVVLALLTLAALPLDAHALRSPFVRFHGRGGGVAAVLPACPDAECNGGETCETCEADCGACPPECGDASCNGDETCDSCEADCGACECGDDVCNGDETCDSCEADCGACEEPVACGEDPDQCLSTLGVTWDCNCAPWHTAAGAWGAQQVLVAPTLPTTTTTANIANAAQCATQGAINGRQLTVTADITGECEISGSDIDLIVPVGRYVQVLHQHGGVRFRVRGSTAGTHSGGIVGLFRFDNTTDFVIDGVDCDGSGGGAVYGGGWQEQCFQIGNPLAGEVTRGAILRTRALAGGYMGLWDVDQLVIADSSWLSGGKTRADVGLVEGWNFRGHGGPITILTSDLRTSRYHVLRPASEAGRTNEVMYVGDSNLVAYAEARTALAWQDLGLSDGIGEGFVVERTGIYTYAHASCGLGEEIALWDVAYSRGTANDFHGAGAAVWTQPELDSNAATGAVDPDDHHWSSAESNTFATWTADPAWLGVGDPADIPGAFTPVYGEGSCPAPGFM